MDPVVQAETAEHCDKLREYLLAGNLKKALKSLKKVKKGVKRVKKAVKKEKKLLKAVTASVTVTEGDVTAAATDDIGSPVADAPAQLDQMMTPPKAGESLLDFFAEKVGKQLADGETPAGEATPVTPTNPPGGATVEGAAESASAAKEPKEKGGSTAKKGPKAKAKNLPAPTGVKSLESFGFIKKKAPEPKSPTAEGGPTPLRFATFNPGDRVVPAALQFWSDEDGLTRHAEEVRAREAADGHSLMSQFTSNKIDVEKVNVVGGSVVPSGFDNEVVFAGWFSTQYEPVEARPAYYGTQNSLLADVRKFAAFPVGSQMPRAQQFDYDYDSGDDWDSDAEEDDSDSESDSGSESGSSVGSWINDGDIDYLDNDDRDDHQVQERRNERRARIRKKDKLVGIAVGPFANLPLTNHPMQCSNTEGDELAILMPNFNVNSIEKLLDAERDPSKGHFATVAPPSEPKKNKPRDASSLFVAPEIATHLHLVMKQNVRAQRAEVIANVVARFPSTKKLQVDRTIMKFYEWHKLSGWMPREVPLADDHPKLQPQKNKPAAKPSPGTASAPAASPIVETPGTAPGVTPTAPAPEESAAPAPAEEEAPIPVQPVEQPPAAGNAADGGSPVIEQAAPPSSTPKRPRENDEFADDGPVAATE